MSRRLTLIAVFATALVLVTAASAALRWRVIGSQRASGDYAVAIAAGNANHPNAVAVRVFARPNQRVSGAWTDVCSKGFGAGSKHGNLAGRTPFLRVLRMPMAHPDSCTASGSAQLSGSGSIRVQILKR